MDTNLEDKMYFQIEQNLSNNINQNLFSTGRMSKDEQGNEIISRESHPELYPANRLDQDSDLGETSVEETKDTMNESYEYYNPQPTLSRAEYIRQAREACLRQLNITQTSHPIYAYQEAEQNDGKKSLTEKKKVNRLRLFGENTYTEEMIEQGETPQELASFRALIIRSVCAIVIFLAVFIIDKFEITIGEFTFEKVKEYVTGKDTLKALENIIVTWLK